MLVVLLVLLVVLDSGLWIMRTRTKRKEEIVLHAEYYYYDILVLHAATDY